MQDEALGRIGVCLLILVCQVGVSSNTAVAQTTSRVGIARGPTNLTLSWTRGTVQSATSLTLWRDVLEATSPFTVAPTNASQFYRAISRWSTRSNLLERIPRCPSLSSMETFT